MLLPGGLLLVFSPNRLFPFETHGVILKSSGKVLPHFVPFILWIPLALGRRIFDYPDRNYWPFELRQLLRTHGFSVLGTGIFWRTFENISGAQPVVITRFGTLLRRLSFVRNVYR